MCLNIGIHWASDELELDRGDDSFFPIAGFEQLQCVPGPFFLFPVAGLDPEGALWMDRLPRDCFRIESQVWPMIGVIGRSIQRQERNFPGKPNIAVENCLRLA